MKHLVFCNGVTFERFFVDLDVGVLSTRFFFTGVLPGVVCGVGFASMYRHFDVFR